MNNEIKNSIFVTGDIHGDPSRLGYQNFYISKDMRKDDQDNNVVIILGDFGLIWARESNSTEQYWLKWLEEKPFTTVFIDGNHENHEKLASFPVKEWNDGKVHEIMPHILHLIRGEVYTINGKKFFAFGGASSHDIQDGILDYEDPEWREKAKKLDKLGKYMYRIKGLSWWEQEMPSGKEYINGWQNLEKNDKTVDYIITHSPSSSELVLMGGKGLYETDALTNYIENVKAECNYNKHLFGHMHVNKYINEKDICLYEDIMRLV